MLKVLDKIVYTGRSTEGLTNGKQYIVTDIFRIGINVIDNQGNHNTVAFNGEFEEVHS